MNNDLPASIRFGFAGSGRMAQALGKGIREDDRFADASIFFVDPSDEAADAFTEAVSHAKRTSDLTTLAGEANLILLAVKPQIMPSLFPELAPALSPSHLVISVAAGITITQLQAGLNVPRIVRVMPNTPCLIGEGMSAIACPPSMTPADKQLAESIMTSVGKVISVDESDLDAVTGLSGSGPAYIFTMIEAMIQAGVKQGLPEAMARTLTLQTVLGATRLVEQSGQSPAALRDQVTSPGGTTLAGLEVLNRHKFGEIVCQAVAAATQRSQELASGATGR